MHSNARLFSIRASECIVNRFSLKSLRFSGIKKVIRPPGFQDAARGRFSAWARFRSIKNAAATRLGKTSPSAGVFETARAENPVAGGGKVS